VVCLDEQTGNIFILAGDSIEIEIYRNALWKGSINNDRNDQKSSPDNYQPVDLDAIDRMLMTLTYPS
jgi:hypothetical protein